MLWPLLALTVIVTDFGLARSLPTSERRAFRARGIGPLLRHAAERENQSFILLNHGRILSRLGIISIAIALILIFAGTAIAGSGEQHFVQSDGTQLYETPTADSAVSMTLGRGTRVLEYRRKGAWVKIAVLGAVGKEGWIELSHLGPEHPDSLSTPEQDDDENEITGEIGDEPVEHGPMLMNFEISLRGAGVYRIKCRYILASGAEEKVRLKGIMPGKILVDAQAIGCRVSAGPSQTAIAVQVRADGELTEFQRETKKGKKKGKASETLRVRKGRSRMFETPWDWSETTWNW